MCVHGPLAVGSVLLLVQGLLIPVGLPEVLSLAGANAVSAVLEANDDSPLVAGEEILVKLTQLHAQSRRLDLAQQTMFPVEGQLLLLAAAAAEAGFGIHPVLGAKPTLLR